MERKPWMRNAIIGVAILLLCVALYVMRSVLSPVFIALAIAYVMDPVVDRLERFKIGRTWGMLLISALILLGITGFSLYLIPRLIGEVEDLSRTLPGYWNKTRDRLLPYLIDYMSTHPEDVERYKQSAIEWLQSNAGLLFKNVTSGLASSFKSIGNFIGNILGLLIIPVLTFYFIRDFGLMKERVTALIPLKMRASVVDLFKELDRTMISFIESQLLVALILSFIYTIGLEIANCPASLLIGLIAGFANLIPYLGLAVGLLPALLLTYLSGNPTWQVAAAGLTFVVGQMLEGMVITPKIVGESVGLHPASALVGLMIGGTYFGFLGMILALPTTAILMVLVRRVHAHYVNSQLYKDQDGDGLPDLVSENPSKLELSAAGSSSVAKPKRRRNKA